MRGPVLRRRGRPAGPVGFDRGPRRTRGRENPISGGGRCNFTNREVTAANFLSENPTSAARPWLATHHKIFSNWSKVTALPGTKKHKGQLFCDRRSDDIIQMLLKECRLASPAGNPQGAPGAPPQTKVSNWTPTAARFMPPTGDCHRRLAIPKIGATGFWLPAGHPVRAQSSHHTPRWSPLTFEAQKPGLPGLRYQASLWKSKPDRNHLPSLTGGKRKGAAAARFTEDLLFTHRGLSGPAVPSKSPAIGSRANPSESTSPQPRTGQPTKGGQNGSRKQLSHHLGQALGTDIPARLADTWLAEAAQQASR